MRSADYVIVGAGSAGCALAGRLSEDPSTRVLLIEAGGRDRHPNIKIPAAAEAAGIPYVDDYNGPEQDGAALVQVTQRNGRRFSAADAYLKPAKDRSNLEIVTGALVSGLQIEGGRATGVRFRDKRGREEVAHAGREVLLSAGALGSPQLLMLSGIGPADQLRQHGIDVVADLPGVGANLQDHPYVVC